MAPPIAAAGAPANPQPGGGSLAKSEPVVMYSYNEDLSFAAPLSGAWVDAEQIYVFLVPGDRWRARGITEVDYECCSASGSVVSPGQIAPTPGSGDPWRALVNLSAFQGGGFWHLDAVAAFADGSPDAVWSSTFIIATSGGAVNNRPSISGSPALHVSADGSYSFRPSASDPDGDVLAFRIERMPSWAMFDFQTGELSGTPGAGDVGVYSNIVISVSDGTSQASLPGFSISVDAMSNGSATLSWVPPTERVDNTPLTDLAGYVISYGPANGDFNESITISNPSVTTYMVENLPTGAYKFVVTAIDSSWTSSSPSNQVVKTVY